MTNDSEAVSNLRALREAVVTKRRQTAAVASEMRNEALLGNNPEPDAGSRFGSDLRDLQSQLVAIDAAIADEQRIEVEMGEPSSYVPPRREPRGVA